MTSAAALRQQRHRQRELRSELCVSVVVTADMIELLVEARLLDPRAGYHDRVSISEAIQKFLALAARA